MRWRYDWADGRVRLAWILSESENGQLAESLAYVKG